MGRGGGRIYGYVEQWKFVLHSTRHLVRERITTWMRRRVVFVVSVSVLEGIFSDARASRVEREREHCIFEYECDC